MPSLAFPKCYEPHVSWFQVSCRVCLEFENAANNGCNIVRFGSFRGERDKTKACVRFEYPPMDLNYPNQHSREKREECELLRLRR